jgi:hypothetical protein
MAELPLMLMTSLALCSCFPSNILLQLPPLHLGNPKTKKLEALPFIALLKASLIGLM